MLLIPHQDVDGHPGQISSGHWAMFHYGGWEGELLRPTAALGCPTCRRLFCLPKHRISEDGVVSPSVVCPHPQCGFHKFVRLGDWKEVLQARHKKP